MKISNYSIHVQCQYGNYSMTRLNQFYNITFQYYTNSTKQCVIQKCESGGLFHRARGCSKYDRVWKFSLLGICHKHWGGGVVGVWITPWQ